MKKFMEEFKAFAMRGNVVDMAVGVVIGGAFGKISTSIVNDVIMPVPKRVMTVPTPTVPPRAQPAASTTAVIRMFTVPMGTLGIRLPTATSRASRGPQDRAAFM